MPDTQKLLDITRTILEACEFCFMITLAKNGQPNARLIQPFEPEKDFTVWIGTSPETRKVDEIVADKRCTLAYQGNNGQGYVTLIGTATLDNSREARVGHWRGEWDAFYGGGPEGDDYVMVKFVPDRIELMDMGRDVAPEPYGLKAQVITRSKAGWVAEE
jgi:general stress protein 26